MQCIKIFCRYSFTVLFNEVEIVYTLLHDVFKLRWYVAPQSGEYQFHIFVSNRLIVEQYYILSYLFIQRCFYISQIKMIILVVARYPVGGFIIIGTEIKKNTAKIKPLLCIFFPVR